jgi:hypothetical protein
MESIVRSAKIADGIWIGSTSAATDQFLNDNDITAVINLDRTKISADADEFTFALPDNELLDMEVPKTQIKLDAIADVISELRGNKRNLLIVSTDGKNKSALAAGYYLTRRTGANPESTVFALRTAYYTSDQTADERNDLERNAKIAAGEEVPAVAIDLAKAEARRESRALTNLSFQKIIRAQKKK